MKQAKGWLLRLLLTGLLGALLLCVPALAANQTVTVPVTYGQTEARKMLDMINDFRTGPDAWAWNSSNTQKVTYPGLKKLQYDYKLEKIAMQRAAELAIAFDHTRPNGTYCTTLNSLGTTQGENIAAGYGGLSDTALEAFTQWQETDKDYSGQGHRRNMLDSRYTAVGIGYAVVDGVSFWVQEFSNAAPGTETEANDSQAMVDVEVNMDIATVTFTPEYSVSTLYLGGTRYTIVPSLRVGVKTAKTFPSRWSCPVVTSYTWEIADESIVKFGKGKSGEPVFVPQKTGSTKISTAALGKTFSMTITVQNPTPISKADFTIYPASYNGNAQEPYHYATYDGKQLTEGTDYTVSYSNNVSAGTATATVTGLHRFSGTAVHTFPIHPIHIAAGTISIGSSPVYTGSPLLPEVTITFQGKTLKEGKDYTLSGSNNTNAVDNAVVTITGKGNFTSSVSKYFSIAKRDITGAKVTVPTCTYCYGPSTPVPTVVVDGVTLAYDKDFVVGYKDNIRPGTATATITARGSDSAPGNYTGRITAQFQITPWDISKEKLDVGLNGSGTYSYSGEAITPVYTVKLGDRILYENTSYTVSYKNNVNAGTATAVITGIGGFTGSQEIPFTISPRSISNGFMEVSDCAYTGSPRTPAVTVKWGWDVLTPDRDYTLSYSNNVGPGAATVTVTGKGNYTGTLQGSFRISELAPDVPDVPVTPDTPVTPDPPVTPDTPVSPDPRTGFVDVAADSFYAVPVAWAVENGITSGTSKTTFEPLAGCTRGQVVTFLWRAAGSPAPKGISNPFSDVAPGKFYYEAVLWAVAKNITKGVSATEFAPDDTCTRGQIVTFLHRFHSTPAIQAANPFTDVFSGAFYYDAVLWAVAGDITKGVSPTEFAPNEICTRGQIVTFLYRSKTQ